MGTGQYDYNIYQALLRIEEILNSMFEFFEPWNEFFANMSTLIKTISGNVGAYNGTYFPIVVACLICLLVVSIVKWLVKL